MITNFVCGDCGCLLGMAICWSVDVRLAMVIDGVLV